MLRYVRGCFDPGSKVTVGAAYLGHRATLDDGRQCKLEVWDTAGQERYSSLAPLYYRGAAAAVVVFDVGDRESFAKARHWVGELQRNAGPGIGERVRSFGVFLFFLLFLFPSNEAAAERRCFSLVFPLRAERQRSGEALYCSFVPSCSSIRSGFRRTVLVREFKRLLFSLFISLRKYPTILISVVVLVGNKVDLPEESRVVPTAEAAEFAER